MRLTYRLGCLVVLFLVVFGIGLGAAYAVARAIYDVVLSRFFIVLVLLLLAGCAHRPDVPPTPTPAADWQYLIPQTIPGSWAFCVEQPHANSRFMTPVARASYVCPMTVDELRIWIASMRPAD